MRIKKSTLKITGLLLVILLLTVLYFALKPKPDYYHVDAQGNLHAPEKVMLDATRVLQSQDDLTIYKTTYKSQGATIVGNLFIPKQTSGKGMLLLPGGGVTKEGETKAAKAFAKRGFIVLTIDQRGVGETGGPYYGIEQDFMLFEQGQIPTEHLLILDALAGIQYLQAQPEVKGKILLSGESMGGRAAIVAARLSKNIEGLLVISSAGYGDPSMTGEQKRFLNSFDPDVAIKSVKVPIVFIHSTNDTTIPLQYAQATFDRAPQPKQLYTIDHCPHGYCTAMEDDITEAIEFIEKS